MTPQRRGTPGCALPDRHDSLCSTIVVESRRVRQPSEKWTATLTREEVEACEEVEASHDVIQRLDRGGDHDAMPRHRGRGKRPLLGSMTVDELLRHVARNLHARYGAAGSAHADTEARAYERMLQGGATVTYRLAKRSKSHSSDGRWHLAINGKNFQDGHGKPLWQPFFEALGIPTQMPSFGVPTQLATIEAEEVFDAEAVGASNTVEVEAIRVQAVADDPSGVASLKRRRDGPPSHAGEEVQGGYMAGEEVQGGYVAGEEVDGELQAGEVVEVVEVVVEEAQVTAVTPLSADTSQQQQ